MRVDDFCMPWRDGLPGGPRFETGCLVVVVVPVLAFTCCVGRHHSFDIIPRRID